MNWIINQSYYIISKEDFIYSRNYNQVSIKIINFA